MYTTVYVKVQIKGDTQYEVMSDSGLIKDVPFPPHYSAYTLMKMKDILDETNKDSMCLFHTVVAILLYVQDVVLESKSRSSLQ